MSVSIDAAEVGIPTEAHCEICGETWTRPAWDPEADTLPTFGLFHRNRCGAEHSSCQACSMARQVGRPGCLEHYPAGVE